MPLGHIYVSERWGAMQLRSAYSHLASEYNRQNSHTDLRRQHIYGTTGT